MWHRTEAIFPAGRSSVCPLQELWQGRLKSEMKDSTCLIVAQRIGTIMDADLILVMENGKVVGQGTHRELLESCPAYQKIAYS